MTAGRPAAAVLVTGQELLLGLVADANTRFLARELDRLGIDLRRVSIVGDGHDEIAAGLRELAGHDLVITSGGLGPTHDDRTVEAVAEAAGAELALDEELLVTIAAITAEYARRRGSDPALNRDGDRKQALVPRGATVIPPAGTAPGLLLPFGGGSVLVLPGPPRELATVWERALELEPIVGAARARGHAPAAHAARLRHGRAGRGAGLRGRRRRRRRHAHDDLRAGARGGGHDPRGARAARRRSRRSWAALHEQLGDAVFAEDERPLAALVLDVLRARDLHLAVAESCTAGLVAARLADIPGSSDVLLGGVIAYANELKRESAGRARGAARRVRRGLGRVRGGDGPGRSRGDRRRGGDLRHGRGGPRRRQRAQAGRASSTCTSRRPALERGQELHLPGDRAQVREWAAIAALQLIRTALS